MQVKTCPATIKAIGVHEGTEDGVFEAIVAAYNVDSVGDRIVPGAFKATLDEWRESGNPIPVLWSHKSDDPDYHIGYVVDAEERAEGLWVKARVDLDEPKSAKVYKLMKGRRVTQFSFAYDELDARPAQKDGSGAVKELHQLKVYEVGPTLVGCNQATALLDVKHQPPVAVTDDDPTARAGAAFHRMAAKLDELAKATPRLEVDVDAKSDDPTIARLVKALDQLDSELVDVDFETKAAPPGFTPKPIVARIRKLVAAAQALLDAVEPDSKPDDGKAMPVEPADALAPEAKSDEPVRHGAASSRLRTDLDLLWAEADSYTI